MKGFALVVALVIASAASSWAVELPKGQFTIKCQEGGKVTFNGKGLTIESFSIPGMLVVKTRRGDPFVVLVGGGQCVLTKERR